MFFYSLNVADEEYFFYPLLSISCLVIPS